MDAASVPASETPENRDIRLNKDIAAFGYIWIMSVFIYFTKKESKFIQYHSKQGIVLFLLTIPLSFIPLIGTYLVFLVVACMLLGFLNAANGQYRDVPCIGPLSRGELSVRDLMRLFSGGLQTCTASLLCAFKNIVHRQKHPEGVTHTAGVSGKSEAVPVKTVDKKEGNPLGSA